MKVRKTIIVAQIWFAIPQIESCIGLSLILRSSLNFPINIGCDVEISRPG